MCTCNVLWIQPNNFFLVMFYDNNRHSVCEFTIKTTTISMLLLFELFDRLQLAL